ncbi:hypothetical protein [Streptosporangium carneum]|uniref:BioF2-like acetyltransferase domain-containing protein n=1 Tax=Streptosporangium carneum TaxID=47481 RepID=A0A9W6MAQ6_9ACTN|nr:hypothetical protein [Streptosporangium carneum]GLK06985.1 hypothetical protein GCM10017600_03900 [Streptosporangium carneum]
MHVEIIDPTLEPVPADWEVFRKQEGLIAAWQAEALTAVAWCAARPVYLGIVREGSQVVGLFSGAVTGLPQVRGRYAEPGALPWVGWFDCRLLVGFTNGFAFAAELGPADRSEAVAAFEKALRRRLGRRCLGVLYRQITADLLPTVGRRFRPRVTTAPNTLLPNRWSDMAGYFADLPRDRRRRLRRVHDEASERTRVMAGVDDIDPVQASVLAQATVRKHGRLAPPLPARYFRALSGEEGVRYFGHLDQELLLSFDLTFDDGRRLVTTVNGSLEVRDGGRRDLYFDLYLREIGYMIAHGREGCEFGKGMAELKQRFGCELVPQSTVIAAW